MADLIEQVNELRSSIETLTTKIGDRPRPALSIDVATGIICKSRSTIYKLVAAGDIPHHKQGNRLYFFEDELVAWIASHKAKRNRKPIFVPLRMQHSSTSKGSGVRNT